jgi:hypothetical protein
LAERADLAEVAQKQPLADAFVGQESLSQSLTLDVIGPVSPS